MSNERLIRAELEAAIEESGRLQSELAYPTVSRAYETQVKLVEASRVASAKCTELLKKLRYWREINDKAR